MDTRDAGSIADQLIATEVAVQDKMWGDANDRADANGNQLLDAGLSQLVLLKCKLDGETPEEATKQASCFYPKDWSGLRDYGSNVANAVVAIAFLRSEVKRRIAAGEDTTRTKRGEAYRGDQPYVSSEKAIEEVSETATFLKNANSLT